MIASAFPESLPHRNQLCSACVACVGSAQLVSLVSLDLSCTC